LAGEGRRVSLEALAQLGELVGGAAVVLSLVYLAFQVRQNTQSLRTENYARALDRVANMQARLGADRELASLFARGTLDSGALGAAQRVQFTWILYELFGAFEFMFHQAEKGALPGEVWERWSQTLAWWISLPGVAEWWRAKPTPFSASFSAFVERRLAAGSAAAAAAGAERFPAFQDGAAPDGPGSEAAP
jgi:hypothetical protein